jgi:putative ABC transport system substrate-binding protein
MDASSIILHGPKINPHNPTPDIEREIARSLRSLWRWPFQPYRNSGLIVSLNYLTLMWSESIIDLAKRHHLPAMYPRRSFAMSGGLVSYEVDPIDQCRRTAGYAHRILKGEKPADLPVQLPSKFVLAVNLKTAKAMDLMIPERVLALANEVIE